MRCHFVVLPSQAQKNLRALQRSSLLSWEGPSFGALETPGLIPFFPFQFRINQLVTEAEHHLRGFMNTKGFSVLIAGAIFSSKECSSNISDEPVWGFQRPSFYESYDCGVLKGLLGNLGPYNRLLQMVHFHTEMLPVAVLFRHSAVVTSWLWFCGA